MSIFWVVIPLALVLLLLLAKAARGSARAITTHAELAAALRPVDLEAFRNLMDPADEEFLRQHLPPSEFRSLQRERLRAAAEYVHCVLENSAFLARFGSAAQFNPDVEVAAAGRELAEQAIQLRWLSLLAIMELRVGILLPNSRQTLASLISGYQRTNGLISRIAQRSRASQVA